MKPIEITARLTGGAVKLAIVDHGGEIGAASRPDGGSRFWFRVCAVGSLDNGPWSDPAVTTVP